MRQAKKESPYLSIIIPSRNDNHGENTARRMEVSLNGLIEQLEKYQIESELILVEWNPSSDKPLLKDVIKWPSETEYCTIRVIQVSSIIHQRYKYSDKIPMNFSVAVNCGIRRARGKFILPGVIDLIYPDEMMFFIANKGLKENERYRTDRCDVNKGVLEEDTLKKQLEYCQKNIVNIRGFHPYDAQEGLPTLHTDACGDFQLMAKKYWHLLRGYWEKDIIAGYIDGLLSYASYAAGIKEVVLKKPVCVYHIDHKNKFIDRIKISRPFFEKFLLFLFKPIKLFLPLSINKKIIFFYHQIIKGKSKSEAYGIPTLDYLEYLDIAREMISGKTQFFLNNENWGLGKEKLPEFIIKKANWDNN